jgi:glycosyltransferase involved in cell wall biosynthesis
MDAKVIAPALSVVQTICSLQRIDGGTPVAVVRLADALVAAGADASVVYAAPRSAGDTLLPVRAPALAVRARRVGNRIVACRGYGAAIGRALGPRGLIHDNGLWTATNILATQYARQAQVPLVISPHGMLEPWALGYRRWRKRLALAFGQRALLDNAALFIVASASEATSVRRAGFRQPIAIVPLGIELPEPQVAHAAIEPPAPARRMLFLSRLHPKKGLPLLFEAWSRLRRPGWKIVLAGPDEGGHRAELQPLIDRLGISGELEFVGEVSFSRKLQLFNEADLFVLPSHSENFGLVVAEAMACGLPVLTTRATPWGVLESLRAGWWVEPDLEGLYHGLRAALAATPEVRAAMGRAGRDYVTQHLTWEAAAQRTLAAYHWLLSGGTQRPAHLQLFGGSDD